MRLSRRAEARWRIGRTLIRSWLEAIGVSLAPLATAAAPAAAEDIADRKEHPVVRRFNGSIIVYYKAADFARTIAAHYSNATPPKTARARNGWPSRGRATEIRYEIPPAAPP